MEYIESYSCFSSSLLFLFFSSLPAMRIAHAILLQNSTGGALPRSRPQCPTHHAHVIAYAWVYTPWAPICRKYFDPSSVSRSLHMHLYVILEPNRFLGNAFKTFSNFSAIRVNSLINFVVQYNNFFD